MSCNLYFAANDAWKLELIFCMRWQVNSAATRFMTITNDSVIIFKVTPSTFVIMHINVLFFTTVSLQLKVFLFSHLPQPLCLWCFPGWRLWSIFFSASSIALLFCANENRPYIVHHLGKFNFFFSLFLDALVYAPFFSLEFWNRAEKTKINEHRCTISHKNEIIDMFLIF